jgi:predicted Zn finger-like uncharacterized protein
MVAACPTCGARYRIDATKLRPEGARLRCSRCETVFRVRSPEPEPEPEAEVVSAAAAPAPRASRPAPPRSQEAPEARSSERLVLVAHGEPDSGKAVANALAAWGLDALLVHDGVEAILTVQRALPRAVVLDAALPKMFGFQICELMKRNEQLRSIHVVLVGAIHDQERYRRPPGELYGADAYVERQDLPEALRGVLRGWGLPVGAEPAAAPSPRAPERAAASRGAAPARAAAPGLADEHGKAERLARIIVSDIVLYNQEKFDAAVRAGNVVEAMASELEEGHQLFAQRIDPRVGSSQDYLNRELLRLAQSRGMK